MMPKLGEETHLHWASAPNDINSFDAASNKRVKCVLGDVRLSQHIDIFKQHTGDVKGDIPLANDYGIFALCEVRRKVGVLRKAVVPANELPSRVDALQTRLPGYAELFVLGCAVGKDNSIIVAEEDG